MSQEYEDWMKKIATVIENREIHLPPQKLKDYEDGEYHPVFSLIDRGGELICLWCSNRKKPNANGEGGDIEIVRIPRPDLGLFTDSDEDASWQKITLKVMRYFQPPITEEQGEFPRIEP